MNALARAQAHWDNMVPDDDGGFSEAVDNWVFEHSYYMVLGDDIKYTTSRGYRISVEYADFAIKVREHLLNRLADGENLDDLYAQLVCAVFSGADAKAIANQLLGESTDSRGKMFEIAESLLEPHSVEAIEGMQDDGELALT